MRPFAPEHLVDRVRGYVSDVWPCESAAWACQAADVYRRQLVDCDANTLATLLEPIGRHRGLGTSDIEVLASVVELLQVAFDMADNLADEIQDRSAGRSRVDGYDGIPWAVRPCVPTMLVTTAMNRLVGWFDGGSFTVAHALNRLTRVLARMMTGQDEQGPEVLRVEMIAGDQALLLCLPWWLTADRPRAAGELERLEAWAVRLGCAWEYTQRFREDPSALGNWRSSIRKLQCCWPDFGPFGPDGPLAVHRVIPVGIS